MVRGREKQQRAWDTASKRRGANIHQGVEKQPKSCQGVRWLCEGVCEGGFQRQNVLSFVLPFYGLV